MRSSHAHIAGIGVSGLDVSDSTVDELAISAGVKALLDAGVSYSDVDQGIACSLDEHLRISRSCFNTFGMMGAPVSEVDNQSGLFVAVQSIRSGQSNCALVIGIDQEASKLVAIATVLVSNLFLTSHAYLKDAAVCIRASSLANRVHSRSSNGPNDTRTTKTALQTALRQAQLDPRDMQIVAIRQGSNSNAQLTLSDLQGEQLREPSKSLENFTGTTELAGLCGLVWQLRGWSHDRPVSKARNALQYTVSQDGAASVLILCRSDGNAAPTWGEVENLRDGRERLGYNPAIQMRPISREDLDNVMARAEFTSDDYVKRLQLRIKGGDRAALARL